MEAIMGKLLKCIWHISFNEKNNDLRILGYESKNMGCGT